MAKVSKITSESKNNQFDYIGPPLEVSNNLAPALLMDCVKGIFNKFNRSGIKNPGHIVISISEPSILNFFREFHGEFSRFEAYAQLAILCYKHFPGSFETSDFDRKGSGHICLKSEIYESIREKSRIRRISAISAIYLILKKSDNEKLNAAASDIERKILGCDFETRFSVPFPESADDANHIIDCFIKDDEPPGDPKAYNDHKRDHRTEEGNAREGVSLVRWPEREGDLTDAAAWRETYIQTLSKPLDGLSSDGWKTLMEELPGFEEAPRPLRIARACVEWLLDKDRVDDPAGALKAASFQLRKEANSGGGKTALTDADRLRDAALLLAPLLFSDTPLDAASPSVTLQVFIAWQQSEAWLSEVSTDAACRGLAGAEALAAASDGEAMQCYELANESDYGADQGSARVELSGRMRIPLPPETGRANYVGRFADEIVKYLEWIRHPAVDPSETTKWVEEHIRERRAKPPDANINAYLKSRKGRDGMRNYYLALPKPEVESDEDEELLARIAIEVKSRLSYIRIIPIHPAVGPDGIEAHAFDAVEALMIKDKDAKA